jgi:hypothetical protein
MTTVPPDPEQTILFSCRGVEFRELRRISLCLRCSYLTFTWLIPGERVKVKCGRISSKVRLQCHLVFTPPGFMLLCYWLSMKEEHELRV